MLLQLSDGTTTLTLTGAGAYLGATYFPRQEADADSVTESAMCVLEGTESEIRSAVQAIELMLAAAARRAVSLGPRVYIQFRPTDAGDIYRSELTAGVLTWSEEPSKRRLGGTLNTVEVSIAWTRRNYWEGAETELYFSSSSQSERTGGVAVYNNDNAGNTNWFQVADTRIVGSLPAPLRLRLTNATGAALSPRMFYLCNNVLSAPASADVWLLGSEAVNGATATWSGSVDHNSQLFVFPLTTTLLGQTEGRRFHVLMACSSVPLSPAGIWVRAAMGTWVSPIFVPSVTGREQYTTSELLDMGTLPVPAGGFGAGNAGAALEISARSGSSGSMTIDFVMLMATDSFRRLLQTGFSLPAGASIEDNGIEGTVYYYSGGSRYTIVRPAGDPLTVFPGKVNRMHMLFDESDQFVAGRQMTVQAWYRPRFGTV